MGAAAWVWLGWLLWGGGTLRAAAQGSGLPLAAENQEWRVVNAAPTPAVWALVEVEFHVTSSCDSHVRGAPITSGEVITSTLGWHPALFAFDGYAEASMARTWWPLCGTGDGTEGCAAEEAWVGQNFDLGAYDIRCARVYQAPSVNHKASEIALDRWTGSAWQRVRVFREVVGEYFVNLPTEPLAKWRLRPLEPLPNGWAVAELSLSEDADCSGNLSAVLGSYGLVGNGSARADRVNDPRRALDGDAATTWAAPCGGPCGAGVPWLELLLGQPGPVRCIRLLQTQASGATALQLQAWTGEQLADATAFLDLRPGAWDHLAHWAAAGRAPGSLWRLLPTGEVAGEWEVTELELHGRADCSAKLPALAAIGSGSLAGSSTGALTDEDLSTYWRGPAASSSSLRGDAWPGRYAGAGDAVHVMGFPWAGVATAPYSHVLCVRLLQSGAPAHLVPAFTLQRWGGNAWEDYRTNATGYGEVSLWYSGLGSEHGVRLQPSWLNLPALDRSQWRVAQLDVLWLPWAIKELRFFQTLDCSVEVAGAPVSAGEDPLELPQPSRQAFDRELSTEWHSLCEECRMREAWLGLLLSSPRSVRCVQLFQSSRSPLGSRRLDLQKWNGHRWASVAAFAALSRGVWDHMHIYGHSRLSDDASSGLGYWYTEADTLWRVVNVDALPLRWAVASLSFYADLDCRLKLTDGRPMASGHVVDFEASAATAAAAGADAEWLSACEGCGAREAWLGMRLPLARRLGCVRLFQSARPRVHVRRAAVERWDGQAWQQEALLTGLEPGSWRSQQLLAVGDRRPRWRVALREMAARSLGARSWRVSGARFFGSGGCRDELHGYHIASGHADGHGVQLAFDEDPETYWESDCKDCGELKAWLGISVHRDSRPVRCVQLHQSRTLAHGAGRVSVQGLAPGAGVWTEAGAFEPLSFGAWDHFHMPAPLQLAPGQSAEASPPGSLWRLTATAPVARSWAIRRAGFFATVRGAECAEQLLGVPIASGQAEGRPAAAAELGEGAAGGVGWQAPCLECRPGTAWLGVLLPAPAEVRCVLLEQSELAPEYTPSVALERWSGAAWQPVRSFEGLGGGVLQQLSAAWEQPAPLQRFRVVNAAEVVGRWRVLELALFASVDCGLEARGAAISSGFHGTSSPALAQDGDATTGWEASGFPPMAAGSRWLGAHFTGPQDVKCALVRQGLGQGEWAARLWLEAWDGEGWRRAAELDVLGTGAWLALHTFSSAWRPLHVNFQDRVTLTPEGWEADVGWTFASRLSGHAFGWNCEVRGVNRQKLNDVLLDTLVELDGCASPYWELEVPVGRYYTRLSYSNPGVGGRSNGCRLEGGRAGRGSYGPKEHLEAQAEADVVDGRLTFSAPAGSGEACEAISTVSVLSMPSLDAMWRVVNGAHVRGSWHIQELEFRRQSTCVQSAQDQQRTGIFSSGYLAGKTPSLAQDGDTATAWASACHGCAPGAAWLGLTFAALEPVRCLRLYQALEPESQAGAVVLERWNGTWWGEFMRFEATPGGLWGQYNERWVQPTSRQRWRLVAEAGSSGMVRVTEAALFEDVGCMRPVQGFAIANEVAPTSPVWNAFDSDPQTAWVSSCGPCRPSEAWLGLHMGKPTEVLCAQLLMGEGQGRRLTSEASEDPRIPFRLDAWNGAGWVATEAVLHGRPGARASVQRLGQVDDLEPGRVWRVVNVAGTTAPWRIQELQFFATSDCQVELLGSPLASSERPLEPASAAFDGDQAYLSAWAAGCPAAGCPAEGEWLGALFERVEAPLCVRLYQSSPTLLGDPAARVIRLERWGDAGWETMRTFGELQPLPSGRWASLTVLSAAEKYRTPAAEWRLVAEGALSKRWDVKEAAFFEDVECREPLLGTPGASGEGGLRFVSAAFDGLPETAWWSQEEPDAREAWLGLAFGRALIVRCVQLLQSPNAGSFADAVQLQLRPEADWLHVFSFSHLASGQWQNLHVLQAVADKPAAAMWRVVNYEDVEEGWVLAELEFYVDTECSKIEVGEPISSGHSIDQDPSLAFDLRLGSWWRSPCRRCGRGRAWLGQSFQRLDTAPGISAARAAEVRCVVLLQDDGTNASRTQTVVLERWDGTAFRRAGKFSGVISGEFVQLRPGGSYWENDTVTVDRMRRQQLLAAGSSSGDPPELREQLIQTRDRVQAFAAMIVVAWPPELSVSPQHLEDFKAAFVAALRTAAAARLRQPRTHVFADDVEMTWATTPGQRAALTATLVVYVAAAGDEAAGAVPWETSAQAVLEKVRGIADDPYNRESLFLTDRLKVELRKENRFSPLRAQVVGAVEPSLELRLDNVLLVPAVPLVPPTPAPPPPPAPPAPPEDRTLMYVLILAGIVLLATLFFIWRWRRSQRTWLQQNQEVWEANNPGIPFPKMEPGYKLFCRRCCRCCFRRTPWDHSVASLQDRRSYRSSNSGRQQQQQQLALQGGRERSSRRV